MQRPNLDLSPPRPREIPSGIPGRAITIVEGSLWTLPSTETKNSHVHVVPLAPLAVEIIRNVPRKTFGGKVSPWIFTTEGDRPIRGYSKAKARLDKLIAAKLAAAFQEEHRRAPNEGEADMARWTIHDLRRTASTEMRRLGVSRYDVERVINHADGTVGGVYDRYDALAEKRHALDTWASYLESLTRPAGDNAVVLRGDGA